MDIVEAVETGTYEHIRFCFHTAKYQIVLFSGKLIKVALQINMSIMRNGNSEKHHCSCVSTPM
jgi:hypothetical protein